jgi:class 3 adenylate cyclase/tetratricopeptide (TPR) repeat protein
MNCPECGNENREGAKFCDSCGAVLAPAPSQPSAERAPITNDLGAAGPIGPVPERVGTYPVSSFLGRGGRKDVYLGEDPSGREVAIALFDTEGVGETSKARARREVQAMERLGDHPHVVTVYDTGEIDGRPFMVSRYMPGGDVQRLLTSRSECRLEPAEAIGIAIDVCRALEHAHGKGVVHRDIKPANVWLAGDGSARLGDFGLALAGGSGAATGTLVGTVAYLPPEQALGRPAGPRADLYSLGALLYEMLAGQPPFVGDDAVSIIGQHLNADPVAPSRHNPAVPAALDRLVLELLAKSADGRPESAAAVRERLEQVRDAPEVPAEAAEENPLEALAGGIFVGREDEMAELRDAADEALAGHGRLVLMAGEPGIGKTRTAEELATYAQVRGAKVFWGRCHEGEGAPSYWPWVQVIRAYVQGADPVALAWEMGSGAAEIARVVPEVAERIGDVPKAPDEEDDQARFRFFEAVANFLGGASSTQPLVLVLDDLHWADEPSLRLLQFLARGTGDAAVLVIGTYRDVELRRDHPLSQVLGELAGSQRASRVSLRGLQARDVARYIEMTAGTEPSQALVETVHEQTEGNPFFVTEVVRLLASEGALENGAAPSHAIPQGVRDVVGRRLNQLSEDANRALTDAAAIGRVFEGEVLAKVAEMEPARLDAALSEAIAAQLLAQTAAGRYRFSHALVRETLYEELSAAQRPQLHRRIAEALEQLYSADPERLERHLAELAHHFSESAAVGDPRKAVDYSVRAAKRAFSQVGYEEAAGHLARALEVLDLCEPKPEERAALLVALGEAQAKAGKFVPARQTLERAFDATRDLGESDLICRAALGIGYVADVGGLDERVVEVLEAALDAIGPEDSDTRARLLGFMAQEHYWVDPQGRSAAFFDEATEMARRLGDERTLGWLLSRGAFVRIDPDSARHGIEMNNETHALAKRFGDRELELRSHVLRLRDYLQLGDIAAVDRDLAAYERLANELRQAQHLWHVPLLKGMRAIIDGRFADAERLANEAREGGERAGEPLSQQFFAIQVSLIYRAQGRLAEIVDGVSAMVERYPAIHAWRVARAMIYNQLGRRDDARGEFQRIAAEGFDSFAIDAQWLVMMGLLCEVVFALDEGEAGAELHDMLEPWSGQVGVAGRAAVSWGPLDRALGLASAAAGNLDRSVTELESSIVLCERMGDRPFLAQTRLNLGQVLLRRGRRGDQQRALELLDQCLDASQELGMRAMSDDALALKLEAQGLAGIDVTTSIDDVISAVESERPDIRAHAAPDGTVTILFSDIENSTLMTERLGDERWIELLRAHNAIFRQSLGEHDGFEVKNQGDGFMLVFPSPTGALRCAIEVQRAFAEHGEESPEERIRVRMGLHTGEAIAEEGDFFGRNVILAARIAARASGEEILVSEALREQADGEDGLAFDDGRELELKGLAGTHTVYRAEWENLRAPA